MKRLVERIIAFVLLLTLLPFLLVILLIIWIESPGAPLFLQKRIGKGGVMFSIYKLRTMRQIKTVSPCLDVSSVKHRIEQSFRITSFGLWLRKYHLDELPQLWNIARGDMTFVGPRPYPFFMVMPSTFYAPRDCNIFPGLTGLWQISSVTTLCEDSREKLDKEYCEKKSVLFDLKIIAYTPVFILKKKYPKELL